MASLTYHSRELPRFWQMRMVVTIGGRGSLCCVCLGAPTSRLEGQFERPRAKPDNEVKYPIFSRSGKFAYTQRTAVRWTIQKHTARPCLRVPLAPPGREVHGSLHHHMVGSCTILCLFRICRANVCADNVRIYRYTLLVRNEGSDHTSHSRVYLTTWLKSTHFCPHRITCICRLPNPIHGIPSPAEVPYLGIACFDQEYDRRHLPLRPSHTSARRRALLAPPLPRYFAGKGHHRSTATPLVRDSDHRFTAAPKWSGSLPCA